MKPKKKKVVYVHFLIHGWLYNLANVRLQALGHGHAANCLRILHTLPAERRVFGEYCSKNVAFRQKLAYCRRSHDNIALILSQCHPTVTVVQRQVQTSGLNLLLAIILDDRDLLEPSENPVKRRTERFKLVFRVCSIGCSSRTTLHFHQRREPGWLRLLK